MATNSESMEVDPDSGSGNENEDSEARDFVGALGGLSRKEQILASNYRNSMRERGRHTSVNVDAFGSGLLLSDAEKNW